MTERKDALLEALRAIEARLPPGGARTRVADVLGGDVTPERAESYAAAIFAGREHEIAWLARDAAQAAIAWFRGRPREAFMEIPADLNAGADHDWAFGVYAEAWSAELTRSAIAGAQERGGDAGAELVRGHFADHCSVCGHMRAHHVGQAGACTMLECANHPGGRCVAFAERP